MTTTPLTTHRSAAARALQAAIDLAGRVRGALRERALFDDRPRALWVLDDAALRDLGLCHSEFAAYGAEASGQAPRTYRRLAEVDAL